MSMLQLMELHELEDEHGKFSLKKLNSMNVAEENLARAIKNFVQNCKPFSLFSLFFTSKKQLIHVWIMLIFGQI